MAESAADAERAAAEQNTLLATKLHVPAPRPDLVARTRLADRLDQGLSRGVVLVCAPAGYGKSVLLADWVRRGDRATGWLSLDVGDNDPARFWRHAVAALDRVRPGIGVAVGAQLGPPPPPTFDGVVTSLINELAGHRSQGEAVLVLDDYHVIDSRQVHATLEFLLQHLPPQLRLVLASRADPPLALARLRARGQLAELRSADLRFTPTEAALLLHAGGMSDSALPDNAVAALATRTEGWAAGLQLAALSLRGQPDVAAFVTAFSGSHRFVLDYLTEEVLERQTEQTRTFLLETSVLDRLSGELCDSVTGRNGSQALLEWVERAGLFLVPLDEVRGWWRYHHLFADLLRARLKQHHPERVRELHRAAADWYARHSLPDEAIGHTLATGDLARAAQLVEEHFDTAFNLRGEEATIRRWLAALPDTVVRTRPRLLLAQAQMAAMRGDVDTMRPLIDAAECAAAQTLVDGFVPTSGTAASLLVNVPAVIALQRSYVAQLCGDPDGTESYASQAATLLADGELMLQSAVQGFLAVADWMRGRLDAAEQAFLARIESWRTAGQPTTTAWASYLLSRIQRAQGRLDAAAQTCEEALRHAAIPGRQFVPAAGPAYAGLAAVAYQRNELDAALDYTERGISVCRHFVHTPPLAACLATLAWLRQLAGDSDGALRAIDEAAGVAAGQAGLLNPVPAQRARLLLAQDDVAAAAQWTKQRELHPDDPPDYPREQGHLVLARVLLAQGQADQALPLLGRLQAAAQRRLGSAIEIGALRALALAAVETHQDAVGALAETLTLAAPQRHIRVFADEGKPMATLLGRLVTAQRDDPAAACVPLGYLADLQRAFAGEADTVAPVALPGMVEPLTGREREVLMLVADGKSNHAIARELVVTVDTVKKHVSHVLLKLGASNRTEAAARGRELRLID